MMVRDFHRVIGVEARRQILETRRPPARSARRLRRRRQQRHRPVPSLPRRRRRPHGRRRSRRRRHHARSDTPRASKAASSACCKAPRPGCSPTTTARSSSPTRVCAGLDYAAVGPEHAYLHDTAASNTPTPPTTRRSPPSRNCRDIEGIIPALESAHAMAYVTKIAPTAWRKDQIIIVNLSGRGDKDVAPGRAALCLARS